jgi:hypothetical protein
MSPYLTERVNRFGDYRLDVNRTSPQPDYTLAVTPFRLQPPN